MINRREFDEEVKNILINKFGYNEFKIDWQELADLIDLNLQKVKYHIFKLEQQGFLRVIERSQRANGYTSPNIIQIMPVNEMNDVDSEDIVGDIKKSLEILKEKSRNNQAYEDEIKQLTVENYRLQERNKALTRELMDLRTRMLELTR